MTNFKRIIILLVVFIPLFSAGCSNQNSKPTKYDKEYSEYLQKYKKVKHQNDNIRSEIKEHKNDIKKLNDTKKEYQDKITNHVAD